MLQKIGDNRYRLAVATLVLIAVVYLLTAVVIVVSGWVGTGEGSGLSAASIAAMIGLGSAINTPAWSFLGFLIGVDVSRNSQERAPPEEGE